jgi:acetyltransferase
MALDARVVLHDHSMTEDRLPKPAIRPYPSHLVTPWKLKDGTSVTIRPIRPEDEPLLVDFHVTLSDRTVYYRYFNQLKLGERVSHQRLTRICFNDYDREIALVADQKDAITGQHEILGVGRLSKAQGFNEAEFAIVVSDRWQNQGLGTELLKRLVQIGRAEKLTRITGRILPENRDMQHVCEKVGFHLRHPPGEAEVEAEIGLSQIINSPAIS